MLRTTSIVAVLLAFSSGGAWADAWGLDPLPEELLQETPLVGHPDVPTPSPLEDVGAALGVVEDTVGEELATLAELAAQTERELDQQAVLLPPVFNHPATDGGLLGKLDLPLASEEEYRFPVPPSLLPGQETEATADCDCPTPVLAADGSPDVGPSEPPPAPKGAAPDPEAPHFPTRPGPQQALSAPGGSIVEPNPVALPAVLAAAGVLAAALLMKCAPVARWLQRLLSKAGLGALFTRIASDGLLRHPRRQALHDLILANPGERAADAQRKLGLSSSTLRHHVRMLEGAKLVRLERTRGVTRLFPRGGPAKPQSPYLGPRPRSIVALIHEAPGLFQGEIGRRLGLSKRAVSHHMSSLRAGNLLRAVRDGKFSRWYPVADAPTAPTAGPASVPA